MQKKKIIQPRYLKSIVLLLHIFLLSILNITTNAQTIERQLISSTGNISKTANINVSATSGEVIINTVSSGTIILTQGFQQPLAEEFVGTFEVNNTSVELTVFPNPTISSVTMKFNSSQMTDLKIVLYDLNGKIILPEKQIRFSGKAIEIFDLNNIPASTYLLIIKDKKGRILQNYKVIKTE